MRAQRGRLRYSPVLPAEMTGPFSTQPVAKIPRQDHSPGGLKIVVRDTTWEHLPFPFRGPLQESLSLRAQQLTDGSPIAAGEDSVN
jgi:hypothetical protein